MDQTGAQEWLENWVDENINSPGYDEAKASMRDEAAACAEQAIAAGISIADLKAAADGDLEEYLMNRQNELTDAEVQRLADKDD